MSDLKPSSRALAALAALALVACSGRDAPTPAAPLDAAFVATSWPLELALSDEVPQVDLLAFGERWLGLAADGSWRPPGEPPTDVTAPLAERWRHEDRLAIELLGRLDLLALCRLGTEPGTFGDQVPEGWVAAELACRALGQDEAALTSIRLRAEAGAGST